MTISQKSQKSKLKQEIPEQEQNKDIKWIENNIKFKNPPISFSKNR